jgi:serine/threonine protein kinase/tetratricopeptide (TPR) repeat protein
VTEDESRSEELESTRSEVPFADSVPERIGQYRILQKLGEGGMGIVYLAEQQEPIHRRVALKVIKVGMDTRQVIARFETERQVLAMMNHPNVAKVFDAGETEEGRPYFAMEYVRGIPVSAHCDRHRLTTRQRLELFVQVCDGVQHAHQKGVIHRDLKPSNILVEVHHDKTVPKIIDFGVAKATEHRLTEHTVFTRIGVMIGTPEYMSPEQADLTEQDIDTRTDVYSLGVLLYELLVGVLPFDPKKLRAAGFDEIRRRIREDEPSRPSTKLTTLGDNSQKLARDRGSDLRTLVRQLRGDLDWITMKAMEKDRTRRYSTASALAADIQRHAAHQPVVAGPPSVLYRMGKFVRRHKVGVMAGGLATAGMAVGLVFATWGMVTAQHERDRAAAEATTARRINLFLQGMLSTADPYRGTGKDTTILEALDWANQRIETSFVDQPRVRADIETTLGEVYRRLGQLDRAEPLLRSGLAGRQSLYGENDERVSEALFCLASLLHDRGDLEDAEPLYRVALDGRRRTLGPRHPEVAMVMNTLARVHRDKGDWESAERLFREVLELRRSILDEDHPDLAVTQFDLAQLIRTNHGDLDEVETLLRESLRINRKAFGENHPDVATNLSGLGGLALARGRLDEAEERYRQALAINRRTLGPDHDEIGSTLLWLAYTLKSRGDPESAVPLAEEALEVYRRAFGDRHPYVASALQMLAVLHRETGPYEKAIPLFRQAFELSVELRGATHPFTVRTQASYGDCLARSGRFEEAEEKLLAAFSQQRDALGESNPDTIWTAQSLVKLYEDCGRPGDAAAYRAFTVPGSTIEPVP